ncbi:hypothetical protein N7468_008395 [Penicillium chermesinum]|uniref:Uncharacterized protein n=1 Tax=Penicillium chermesinum TaxID=63820 RepID=A0A9W9NRY7_9EURO|nr:uncharacterized protein N7468_008395 [Penicillium chermesinum]KAJ5223853.1 hypothetical protein N7468_008395 [Penicillium chermesinum]KAJ6155320.1 hypothetical protein N7470_005886 [Penicillium chermesinum]
MNSEGTNNNTDLNRSVLKDQPTTKSPEASKDRSIKSETSTPIKSEPESPKETSSAKAVLIEQTPEQKEEHYKRRDELIAMIDHAITIQLESVGQAQHSVDFMLKTLPSELKGILDATHIKESAEDNLQDISLMTASVAETYSKCCEILRHTPGVKEQLTMAKWDSDGDITPYIAVIQKTGQLSTDAYALFRDLAKVLDFLRPAKETLLALVPAEKREFVPDRL